MTHPLAARLLALVLALPAAGCIDYDVNRNREFERWTQPERAGGVDILWVVDDSQSMYEEQALLAEHASTFIGFLTHVPVDFRLGVVNTDMEAESAGSLTGELLDPDSPGLVEGFSVEVANEATGSREERGFDAALLGSVAMGGAGDLELVFFSDEDDQSEGSAADFLTALGNTRPGAAVVANAIVGDLPEGCASREVAADPGDRYLEAQDSSGGARESICTADYDAMLERIAARVLGLQDTFALAKVPELSSAEIRVDEVLIPERERHGWRYDAGDNAIVFDGYAVPPPGAVVTARYYEWAGAGVPVGDTGK